ncbi:MAG: GGDEF domain-containing protein, partial [Spirochaetaceae bacterium]|nr:GGDEF domain-containing protein [Spirochaetaceae bacterium]
MESLLRRLRKALGSPEPPGVERSAAIGRELLATNWKRVKFLSIVIMIFESSLIVARDLPSILGGGASAAARPWARLALRGFLFLVGLVGLVLSRKAVSGGGLADGRFGERAIPVMGTLFISAMAVATSLDRASTRGIDAVVPAMVLFAAFLAIRPALNLAMYTVAFAIYLASSFAFRGGGSSIAADAINGAIFYLAIMATSIVHWDARFGLLARQALLDEADAKLDFLSLHDTLTGLPNRRRMEIRIEEEIPTILRYKDQAAIAIADVDGFKALNDRYGHSVGEEALKRIAGHISRSLRGTDMAARWSEEIFILFFARSTDVAAVVAAERTRALIDDVGLEVDGERIPLTVSIGIAQLRAEGERSLALACGRADRALDRAKSLGGNRVELYVS